MQAAIIRVHMWHQIYYQRTCHISDMDREGYNKKVSVVPVQAVLQRIPYLRRKTYNPLMRAISTISTATAARWVPTLPSFVPSISNLTTRLLARNPFVLNHNSMQHPPTTCYSSCRRTHDLGLLLNVF